MQEMPGPGRFARLLLLLSPFGAAVVAPTTTLLNATKQDFLIERTAPGSLVIPLVMLKSHRKA
jgi:hypothetical protein